MFFKNVFTIDSPLELLILLDGLKLFKTDLDNRHPTVVYIDRTTDSENPALIIKNLETEIKYFLNMISIECAVYKEKDKYYADFTYVNTEQQLSPLGKFSYDKLEILNQYSIVSSKETLKRNLEILSNLKEELTHDHLKIDFAKIYNNFHSTYIEVSFSGSEPLHRTFTIPIRRGLTVNDIRYVMKNFAVNIVEDYPSFSSYNGLQQFAKHLAEYFDVNLEKVVEHIFNFCNMNTCSTRSSIPLNGNILLKLDVLDHPIYGEYVLK